MSELTSYEVEVKFSGVYYTTIEAESEDDAWFQAQNIAAMECPSECEVDEISIM